MFREFGSMKQRRGHFVVRCRVSAGAWITALAMLVAGCPIGGGRAAPAPDAGEDRTVEPGAKVLLVGGPAIVHTGAGPHLEALIHAGYIDVLFAGILGVGLYFWFSGRVWCRFACPLAALMHIYARFSQFRIFADKKKCISCNVCTSVCHQGIDVMGFANKGLPMEDPQCVRCSACVQACPTGTLTFGRTDAAGNMIADRLAASPVQMKEDKRLHLPMY